MIFIKDLKLFVIFALSLTKYIQARSMLGSPIDDVRIEIIDGKWICDQIECPLDADRCYVSKSNKNSPSVLVRTNICYSKDNKVITEKTLTTPTDPNHKINMQVASHGTFYGGNYNGNFKGGENFDEKKFKEELDRNMQNEMAGINQELDEEMKNLHANLNQMKEDINSDLQHEMNNLQEELSKMQYDLAHMFD